MPSSLAQFIDEPVLLAREQCKCCCGEGKVPTPEFAGWSATVERVKCNVLAETGASDSRGAYEVGRRHAGDPPSPTHTDCTGCEGRGFNEIELGLDRLASFLRKDDSKP